MIRLFHRNINFRYTQGCTLGKSHNYAAIGIGTTLGRNIISVAIVTKLSKGKGIFLYTWGLTTSEKCFSCSHWNKFVLIFGNLILHLILHIREKLQVCNQCDKDFAWSSDFIIYMERHTEEKPYQCNICVKSINVNHDLVIHMNTQTGWKPYQWQTLTVKGRFNVYLGEYTGEKRYQCS